MPKPLKYCEELFDNVLEIKQLVKDIGDWNTLIHREQKTFVLYDDSNIVSNTFFTELNKNIQSYGKISLQYNYNNEKFINWENKSSFKINHNIKKEFITLQLEHNLTPKKIETEDSKITFKNSNAQMKYLPEKLVKKLLETMLYSNKQVYLTKDVDRRPNNDDDNDKRSHLNLTYQIAQLKDYIFEKHVYRILFSLIVDLGLVNFSMKTNTKIILTLERNMNKLFESNKKLAGIPDNPDALIQIYDRPYISYQEINLTKSTDIYFNGILRSETALRQGVLPSLKIAISLKQMKLKKRNVHKWDEESIIK